MIFTWLDEMTRAVLSNNLPRMAEIAAVLDAAEQAKGILCAKNYGSPDMSIVDIVRMVPDANEY